MYVGHLVRGEIPVLPAPAPAPGGWCWGWQGTGRCLPPPLWLRAHLLTSEESHLGNFQGKGPSEDLDTDLLPVPHDL